MSRDRQSFVEDVKKAYDCLGGLKSMENVRRYRFGTISKFFEFVQC